MVIWQLEIRTQGIPNRSANVDIGTFATPTLYKIEQVSKYFNIAEVAKLGAMLSYLVLASRAPKIWKMKRINYQENSLSQAVTWMLRPFALIMIWRPQFGLPLDCYVVSNGLASLRCDSSNLPRRP
jgi:hypothetical protein